jgi:cysteine desulfurase
MNCIYLDHNATSPVDPRVVETMLPYFSSRFGNPSSVHRLGQEAYAALDQARSQISSLLHCRTDEIIFTGGGTESNNIALQGIVHPLYEKGNHIITSQIEHTSILSTCKYLENIGCKVTYLPVDETGLVNPDDLKKAITPKTILISIMFANNEIGTIQPIAGIGRIAKEHGILFHSDAIQAAGKIPLNVNELNLDLVSISAHKFYGPKGTGVLYIRKGTKISPLLFGGHHEQKIKPGTENVPNIVGMGKAAELAMQSLPEDSTQIHQLRDNFFNSLASSLDDIRLNGHPTLRLDNTVNIGFNRLDAATLLLNLDMEDIACSTGSACSEGSTEISHVLKAIHTPLSYAQGSLRFSLGKGNTQEEIDFAVSKITQIVKRLRHSKSSPTTRN